MSQPIARRGKPAKDGLLDDLIRAFERDADLDDLIRAFETAKPDDLDTLLAALRSSPRCSAEQWGRQKARRAR